MIFEDGMDGWTAVWPETAGWFWFYCRAIGTREDYRMRPVQVRKARNGWIRFTEGEILYPSEYVGLWREMPVPEEPF